MKRVLFNKVFIVWFVLFCAIFYFFFKSSAFSFSRMWIFYQQKNNQIWTDYSRSDLIDNMVVGLVIANSKLGKWSLDSSIYIDNTIKTLSSAKLLVNTDPVWLVANAANKKSALQTHILQLENARDKLSDYSEQFLSLSDENKNEATICLNQKNQWDSDFFNWLTNDERDTLKDWLQTSVDGWPCYIKNRIYANAYYKLYDKSNFYKWILTDKINLLTDNSDVLLENYKVFQNNYLAKLNSLSFQLAKYTWPSVDGADNNGDNTIDVTQ